MATITAHVDPERRAMATERYTRVAITLHWLIATAILYNLTSGLLNDVLPRWFFVFHVSSGLTILILSVARVVWRLTHKPPRLLPMQGWERGLAHGVHFLLYAAMLLIPFSGWAMISARPPVGSPGAAWSDAHPAEHRPAPVRAKPGEQGKTAPAPRRRQAPMFWGVVPVPMIGAINEIGRTPDRVPEQRALHERIETVHSLGGWVLLALFVLHVAGALKHQWIDREPELARMGVGRRTRTT
ncbi:cytochrome b [uncultured Sphingomonas sp.]|uniref:cytochrome b n=1 Tax=uncultured Sphingomonas sp. TaxID=158754 RepID=UPI0035CC6945